MIKQSIERVGASSASLVTTEQDLKSELSKSVVGDQSFTMMPISKTPEIEDIMMAVTAPKLEEVVPVVEQIEEKKEEKPKEVVEKKSMDWKPMDSKPKTAEAGRYQSPIEPEMVIVKDDDYDEDFE